MTGKAADIHTQLLDNAGMCWLQFRGRGTWSFADDRFEIYLPDNMSEALRVQHRTDLRDIPHAAGAWHIREQPRLHPEASTFVVPADAFLARVWRADDGAGEVNLGFYRHLGTSPADAVDVRPQEAPIGFDWAALATASVNPPTEFWFRCKLRAAANGAVHRSRFEIVNPTGEGIELRMVQRPDPSSAADEEYVGAHAGDGPVLTVEAHRVGDEVLLWQVIRSSLAQQGFEARWFTTLNFLVHDPTNPAVLTCLDETGVDVFGGDEITLKMRPDANGDHIVLLRRDDVDTGEDIFLPLPKEAGWDPVGTGYVTGLEIRIEEPDTLGDDVDTRMVAPLPEAAARGPFAVPLEPGTSVYRLNVHIVREPE